MALYLVNLDGRVRRLMLEEMEYDSARNRLYISPLLSGQGQRDYPNLLREALESGDDESLAASLRAQRRIARTHDRRKPRGGYSIATIPATAAEMLAEGQFNRYYIRALARRAMEDGIPELIVYRAKPVSQPRPASEERVETTVSAAALLDDLRAHVGEEPGTLGVPGGPNSGLSVRLP